MSKFAVEVKKIKAIEPHPNADRLELAVIDGYRTVIAKGYHQAGDLVAYIKEGSVVPQWILQLMGFWDAEKGKGTLAGTHGNRVKALSLRGVISQGILFPLIKETDGNHSIYWCPCETPTESGVNGMLVHEGDDVAEWIGVTKYVPVIPTEMSGEVAAGEIHWFPDFDVENWQSHPDLLEQGELVVITEKLHGTFTGITVLPEGYNHPDAFGRRENILVYSKGIGCERGMFFKNNEINKNNLYVRSLMTFIEALEDSLECMEGYLKTPMHILGETTGRGVQDLHYDVEQKFRLFAVAYGWRHQVQYHESEVDQAVEYLDIDRTPVLYRGEYSESILKELMVGDTVLGGSHIREGVVVNSQTDRVDPAFGHVRLKAINPAYLTRKGGTEYN